MLNSSQFARDFIQFSIVAWFQLMTMKVDAIAFFC